MFKSKTISWSDVTIDQLIKIKELPEFEENYDRAIHVVSIVYDKTIDEIEAMPFIDVLTAFAKCEFLNTLPSEKKNQYVGGRDWNGRRRSFRILYNLTEIKAHHYIELQHILGGSTHIEKMAEVMALISVEQVGFPFKLWDKKIAKENILTEYEDRVKFFKSHCNVAQCYPVMLFFSLLWNELYSHIQSYLEEKMMETQKMVQQNQ